jgi:hypothetical protein
MATSIDYKKALACWAKEHSVNINVNALLSKSKGKETKLILRLAKQYDKPNPLNGAFKAHIQDIDITNHRKVVELYLTIYYPSEADQLDNLVKQYEGNEKELISKLQTNFNACDVVDPASEVDYKEILTKFLTMADQERVNEVESTLEKCKGRETILFAVLSKEYKLPNPLNEVFVSRVNSIDSTDVVSLVRLYLSIFNPKIAYRAQAFVNQYLGRETELFAKLAEKFHAINPLELDGVGKQAAYKSPVKPSTDGCTEASTPIIQAQSPGIVA